jgi:hypothetical protein
VATSLTGTSNGLLQVLDVRVEDLENGNQEIQIEYQFQGSTRVKRVEVVILKELSYNTVLRNLPNKGDKVVLMKLEIPLIPSTAVEKHQYDEVYDLVRRRK